MGLRFKRKALNVSPIQSGRYAWEVDETEGWRESALMWLEKKEGQMSWSQIEEAQLAHSLS